MRVEREQRYEQRKKRIAQVYEKVLNDSYTVQHLTTQLDVMTDNIDENIKSG